MMAAFNAIVMSMNHTNKAGIMKMQHWVIVPVESHISFEIPSGNLDTIQGYCSNLTGKVESQLHEFEDARLLLEIPVKYLSISDRSLSSLLNSVKSDACNTCTVLLVDGIISETNFDEVYTFRGTFSAPGYRNHFSMYVTGGNETNDQGNVAESCFEFTGQLDTSELWPKEVTSLIRWKDLSTQIIVRGKIKIKRVNETANEKSFSNKINSI